MIRSKKRKSAKRVLSGLLTAVLAAGVLTVPSAEVYADYASDANMNLTYVNFKNINTTNSVTLSDTQDMVTWNKIDSEQDYEDFLMLTKQDGGVKVLLVFTDSQTGEKSVLGGYDWERSESSSGCAINRYYHKYTYDGEEYDNSYVDNTNHMYWMVCDGENSVVQGIDSCSDGFSTLKNGADQIVTYGSAGSFTAVSDELTEDTEDFDLLTNASDGSTKYLTCQEGAPFFWEDYDSWSCNDYYMDWILPILGTSTDQASEQITVDYECGHSDYSDLDIDVNINRAWKLGQWSTTSGSGEKSWDVQYIYQDTMDPAENFRGHIDGGYYEGQTRDMRKWTQSWDEGTWFKYGYTLLAAQAHSGYKFCTGIEWVSKKEIGYYDGPDNLYQDQYDQDVLGGIASSRDTFDEDFWTGDWTRRMGGTDYRLQCGFEVYYGVDGISKSALYENSTYEHNADLTTATTSDASYVAHGSVMKVSGNELKKDEVYTVKKNQYIIIPDDTMLTIDEGATLVVSRNAVLVLNGGILNRGTILVQPGGMILRYTSPGLSSHLGGTSRLNSYVAYDYGVYTSDAAEAMKKFYETEDSSYIKDLKWGVDWGYPVYRTGKSECSSCIICDGGNFLIRDGGRVRVNFLSLSGQPKDSLQEKCWTIEKMTMGIWPESYDEFVAIEHRLLEDSVKQTTLENRGYILTGSMYRGSGLSYINKYLVMLGDSYETDMLTGVSIETCMNACSGTASAMLSYYSSLTWMPDTIAGGAYTKSGIDLNFLGW